MKLVKGNKVKYTKNNPFPKGEVVGKRWLIVSDCYQVARLSGQFYARNVNPKSILPDRYFPTLKEAINYAESFRRDTL